MNPDLVKEQFATREKKYKSIVGIVLGVTVFCFVLYNIIRVASANANPLVREFSRRISSKRCFSSHHSSSLTPMSKTAIPQKNFQKLPFAQASQPMVHLAPSPL